MKERAVVAAPRFDLAVGQNGYAWWYLDAVSADGAHGLTVIAFIGSVFSPYYAWARSRGRGDPENHVTMNVALDGQPRRWAMTERGRTALHRSARHIAIGASAMRWDESGLTIDIDETTIPIPSRLRGRITVRPRAIGTRQFQLDAAGQHRWQPIAPASDVEVRFDKPNLSWRGSGYFDTNDGDAPLEDAFQSWTWSRFDAGNGAARIFYDVVERGGLARGLSLNAGADGVSDTPAVRLRSMPRSIWGIDRRVPCDPSNQPAVLRTMENAPFYVRSSIRSTIEGRVMHGVNESLSLTRATAPIVRAMLPFKMFRRGSAANRGVG